MSRPYIVLATASSIRKEDFDAQPLLEALATRDLDAKVLAWDEPGDQAGFAQARACVLRSTWNYVQKYDQFLPWIDWCARVTMLWNPAPVVRWNAHKQYLLELEARGLPVVPTKLVRRGEDAAAVLAGAFDAWGAIVVKPAVSAGSFGTIRANAGERAVAAAHLDAFLPERDMLIQRFEPAVNDHGERSLIWIDGAFSHAIRKNPRFVGQEESVSNLAMPIASDERTLAERVLAVVPQPLLYARIDLVRDADGQPQVMEVELIEPSLFFAQHPGSADRIAAAIADRVAT
jgi:glutathione synthase/RimK-type ligase-like ATP-grasp enzyme